MSEDKCPVCGEEYDVVVTIHSVSDMIVGIEEQDYDLHTYQGTEYLHRKD